MDLTAILDGKNEYENAENKWDLLLPKINRQFALESEGSTSAKSLLERQKVELDELDGVGKPYYVHAAYSATCQLSTHIYRTLAKEGPQ